jgi:hypothetical protein
MSRWSGRGRSGDNRCTPCFDPIPKPAGPAAPPSSPLAHLSSPSIDARGAWMQRRALLLERHKRLSMGLMDGSIL